MDEENIACSRNWASCSQLDDRAVHLHDATVCKDCKVHTKTGDQTQSCDHMTV